MQQDPKPSDTPETSSEINIFNDSIFEYSIPNFITVFRGQIEVIITQRRNKLESHRIPEPFDLAIARTAFTTCANLLNDYEQKNNLNLDDALESIKNGNQSELAGLSLAIGRYYRTLYEIVGNKELCLAMMKLVIVLMAEYPGWYRYVSHLNKDKDFRIEGSVSQGSKHLIKRVRTYQEWYLELQQIKSAIEGARFAVPESDKPNLAQRPSVEQGGSSEARYWKGRSQIKNDGEQ